VMRAAAYGTGDGFVVASLAALWAFLLFRGCVGWVEGRPLGDGGCGWEVWTAVRAGLWVCLCVIVGCGGVVRVGALVWCGLKVDVLLMGRRAWWLLVAEGVLLWNISGYQVLRVRVQILLDGVVRRGKLRTKAQKRVWLLARATSSLHLASAERCKYNVLFFVLPSDTIVHWEDCSVANSQHACTYCTDGTAHHC